MQPLSKKWMSPKALGKVVSHLPSVLNTFTANKLVNRAFNEQIMEGDFNFLENRLLQVNILDASIFAVFSFKQNQIQCLSISSSMSKCDATLSISAANAIQLVQQKIDPDTLFFQRQLKIEGDTELVHQTKNIIDTLDPESLPKLVNRFISIYYDDVLS